MKQFRIQCKFHGNFPEKILASSVLWIFPWKLMQMKAYVLGFQKMYTLPRVWAGELSSKSVQSAKMWQEHPSSRSDFYNFLTIWNILNSTPLMQKILCALVWLYLMNILILNLGGNSENYKCVFFSWHTSQNWQKRQIFGKLWAMSKKGHVLDNQNFLLNVVLKCS